MGVANKVFGLGALLSFDEGNSLRKMGDTSAAASRLEGRLLAVGTAARGIAGDLRLLSIGAGIVTAGLGYASSRTSAWQSGLARINTLLTGPESGMLPGISKGLDSLSKKYGLMAEDAQEAMFQAISAAVPAEESVRFMDVAARAAVGGTTGLTVAVDGLTSTLNAFSLGASNAELVADLFFVANKRGKTTFAELAASIGQVAPTFAAAQGQVDELVAAIARVTKVGIRTPEAATGIKAAMNAIIGPAEEATKVAKKLGLEFNVAGMKRAGGFVPFLAEVQQKTGGNVVALRKLFSSVEAVNAVAAMTANGGVKDLQAILAEMRSSSGATTEAFEKIASSPAQAMAQARARMDSLMRQLGEMAMPVLGALGRMSGKFAELVEENRDKIQGFLKQVGGEIDRITSWIETRGVQAMTFLLEHAEGIYRASRETLKAWVAIRGIQLTIAGIQTVQALRAASRGQAGGGLGLLSGLLGGLLPMAGAGGAAAGAGAAGAAVAMQSVAATATQSTYQVLSSLTAKVARRSDDVLGAMAAEAQAKRAIAANMQRAGEAFANAGKQAEAVVGTSAAPGTLFGPALGGIKTFGGAFSVIAAGMVGWTIGSWLNSLGADELVYNVLRGVLDGGGTTTDEEKLRVLAEDRRRFAVSSQKSFAKVLSMAATAKEGWLRSWNEREGRWVTANQTNVGGLAARLAESTQPVEGRRQEEMQWAARGFLESFRTGEMAAWMGSRRWKKGGGLARAKEDMRALLTHMSVHPETFGLTPQEAPTAAEIQKAFGYSQEQINEANRSRALEVNVEVPVEIELDGKKVGKGVGKARQQETRRGADDSYSLTTRSLVVRGNIIQDIGGFRPQLGTDREGLV